VLPDIIFEDICEISVNFSKNKFAGIIQIFFGRYFSNAF